MTELLPKDPTKALVEIKETLTERLIKQREYYKVLIVTGIAGSIEVDDEIEFLENLLDIIERS